MNNRNWKKAFFLLLAFNLLVILSIGGLLLISPGGGRFSEGDGIKGEAVFDVRTKKEDLDVFINHYLKQELGEGSVDYSVLLTDQVELIGELPIFNQRIEINLTFVPEALDNGDVLLTQNSIKIGTLRLPVSYVMGLIKKSYKFPDWVDIYPNERIIYIHLTDIELKNDMRVAAKKLDLKNDDIEFSIHLAEER